MEGMAASQLDPKNSLAFSKLGCCTVVHWLLFNKCASQSRLPFTATGAEIFLLKYEEDDRLSIRCTSTETTDYDGRY